MLDPEVINPLETDDDISSEASIIEIEGYGPVIFFASGSEIYAIDSNGDNYGNWPIQLDAEVISSIVFAKVGSNSTPHLMFGDDSGNAHLYSVDGVSYQNFPISYDFPFKGSPTVLDTDADGDLELIIGSTQTLTNIDIKESGSVQGLWATHRSNMKRDGHYLSNLDALDISDEIMDYEFALNNAYPNPFNPSTTIGFSIPYSMDIVLNVYDISGRLVKTLVDETKYAGFHSCVWDGRDQNGNSVSNGLYIYKL